MDIELVAVGNELLLGFTVNTNVSEIATRLSAVGVRVSRVTTVGDEHPEIASAVRDALARTGFVVVTGGLGPTRDDVTREAVADVFARRLVRADDIVDTLRDRFRRFGREMPEANLRQADVPEGAEVLDNRWGTAPGLWIEGTEGVAVLLPGVPREMRKLMEREVVPRVEARQPAPWVIRSRVLRTTGVAESALADRLAGVDARIDGVSLAFLPSLEGVDLRVTVWRQPTDEAGARLDRAMATLREVIGPDAYGEDSDDLAAIVLDSVRRRGWRMAVAESCTGGLVGGRVTAVPGSSDVFAGGIIAYDNAVKVRELDVNVSLLEAEGAVSEAVARAMAEGVATRFGVDVGIGVTGIAGPGGGTEDKPSGTVHYAVSVAGESTSRHFVFPGGRQDVRLRATQAALDLLRRRVERGVPA